MKTTGRSAALVLVGVLGVSKTAELPQGFVKTLVERLQSETARLPLSEITNQFADLQAAQKGDEEFRRKLTKWKTN